VFDRPIGQKTRAIQHPLAENWMYLESAWQIGDARPPGSTIMTDPVAPKRPTPPNSSVARARPTTPRWQAIMTHGGFGYAREYHVERLFREVSITRLAPITEQFDPQFHCREGAGAAEELLKEFQRFTGNQFLA